MTMSDKETGKEEINLEDSLATTYTGGNAIVVRMGHRCRRCGIVSHDAVRMIISKEIAIFHHDAESFIPTLDTGTREVFCCDKCGQELAKTVGKQIKEITLLETQIDIYSTAAKVLGEMSEGGKLLIGGGKGDGSGDKDK